MPSNKKPNLTAEQALERLREGNERFSNGLSHFKQFNHTKALNQISEQQPIAIILGCSDSRVPAEIIFDQGLGDLFVIRVAGNIVAPSQIGSVEFAAARFGTPIVIVLGHSHCGAVQATIDYLTQPDSGTSKNLMSIVHRVRPSVEMLLQTELKQDLNKLSSLAVKANVSASVNQLRHGSEVLENLIQNQGLVIKGAEYSIETGRVEFYDI